MRAAVLTEFGAQLTVRELPDPKPHAGEVLVEVLAASVAPYADEVFGGIRNYPLVPPVVPGIGGVGRIVHIGPDATRLRAGDLVWCDMTVRSRDDALTPDIALQGWSSRGEGGAALARHLHDGAFAELMRVPTENVFPLPAQAADDPARWAAIGAHIIPYGGLLAAWARGGGDAAGQRGHREPGQLRGRDRPRDGGGAGGRARQEPGRSRSPRRAVRPAGAHRPADR